MIGGVNTALMLSVFYSNCIKAEEEEASKKDLSQHFLELSEKSENQDAPLSSSHSSHSSSPLPSGFSDISVDESQLLEEFFRDAISDKGSDELPLSDHSSLPSLWHFSGSSSFSNHSQHLENNAASLLEEMNKKESNPDIY